MGGKATSYICAAGLSTKSAASLPQVGRCSRSNHGWRKTWAFLYSHGQSLDWINSGDPTGLICSAAAKSARAAQS
jgi:hypothetical protein